MLDVNNLSEEELLSLEKDIKKRKDAIKEEKLRKNQEIAHNHIEKLKKVKEYVLPLIEHRRTSCSDDNPCNGYYSGDGYARCPKCHLIEILNGVWGDDFDFSLNVEIEKVTD